MLRPLPGFRSIGVTGRYWGFLALPLSLLGAAVLWRFLAEAQGRRRLHVVAGLALLLQIGFQSSTLLAHWVKSPLQTSAAMGGAFRNGPESIDYVQRQEQRLQGEFITPTRAVVNCYDLDDFIRADIGPGKNLVRRLADTANQPVRGLLLQAKFVTWSHIRISRDDSSEMLNERYDGTDSSRLRVVLNQAYHPLWQADGCSTLRSERGNLILECPIDRLRGATIDLTFNDQLSRVAAGASQLAWAAWLPAASLLLLLLVGLRLRPRLVAPLGAPASIQADSDQAS
jgi:hypothetical protein